jgi:Bacteriocin-protection, YdeI or OmpD-Associated/Domain of unknown function (DUF1905)
VGRWRGRLGPSGLTVADAIRSDDRETRQRPLLEIPFDVKAKWGKARAPVATTINDHTFRSTVAVYGGRYLLGLNREAREAAGVGPGDRVVVDLELDTAERTVEVPPELHAVFAREPELRALFESLSFTHRKEYVRWIENAKREETRRARATKAVELLRNGVKTPG